MASLGKRKNKKGETIWVIRYRIGRKQKLKTIGKTDKRTAQKILVQFESELAKKAFRVEEIKNISLKEFEREYLKLAQIEKAATTFTREKHILKLFIEYFGDVAFNSVSTKELEGYRLERLRFITEGTVNLE